MLMHQKVIKHQKDLTLGIGRVYKGIILEIVNQTRIELKSLKSLALFGIHQKNYLIRDLRKHFDIKINRVMLMHQKVIKHQKDLTLGIGRVYKGIILEIVNQTRIELKSLKSLALFGISMKNHLIRELRKHFDIKINRVLPMHQ